MHQQNQHGPVNKGKVDLMKTTYDSLIHFMGIYVGQYIEYDEEEAWKNYRRYGRDKVDEGTTQEPSPSSNVDTQGQSSQEGRIQEQAKAKKLDMFLKVKRALSDYTFYLRKDDEFPSYQRRIVSTSKAHETYFILDPDTDPLEACGHEEIMRRAQAYMYLVFTETLLTAKGIEFVKDYPGDARKVWHALTCILHRSVHTCQTVRQQVLQGYCRIPHSTEEPEEA